MKSRVALVVAVALFAAGLAISLLSLAFPTLAAVGVSMMLLGLTCLLLPVLYRSWRDLLNPPSPAATRSDLKGSIAGLAQEIEKSRSSDEWRTRQQLSRLERQHSVAQSQLDAIAGDSNSQPNTDGAHRILFMTSNGAGLGHLTRMLAVAEELKEAEIAFFSLSAGSVLAAEKGYETRYFPSFESSPGAMSRDMWRRRFSRALSSMLDSFAPDAVMFDGPYVYEAITGACRARGIPLIWMQRGCWKAEADAASKQRHDATSVCDAVIIPGDYGCDEHVDTGAEVAAHHVAPISLVQRGDLLSREAACEELGLNPSDRHVLIQLGAGAIGSIESSRSAAIDAVSQLGDDWNAVTVISPLAKEAKQVPGAMNLQGYPIAKYANAFTHAVVAAGYNAAQECVGLGLPTIFIPNPDTLTDDQERRAASLAALGYGLSATSEDELRAAITRLADETENARLREHLETAPTPQGASDAAVFVTSWIDRAKQLASRQLP